MNQKLLTIIALLLLGTALPLTASIIQKQQNKQPLSHVTVGTTCFVCDRGNWRVSGRPNDQCDGPNPPTCQNDISSTFPGCFDGDGVVGNVCETTFANPPADPFRPRPGGFGTEPVQITDCRNNPEPPPPGGPNKDDPNWYLWKANCTDLKIQCSVQSDCPENTFDNKNVQQAGSNWCYGFAGGNRCMMLVRTACQTGSEQSCGFGPPADQKCYLCDGDVWRVAGGTCPANLPTCQNDPPNPDTYRCANPNLSDFCQTPKCFKCDPQQNPNWQSTTCPSTATPSTLLTCQKGNTSTAFAICKSTDPTITNQACSTNSAPPTNQNDFQSTVNPNPRTNVLPGNRVIIQVDVTRLRGNIPSATARVEVLNVNPAFSKEISGNFPAGIHGNVPWTVPTALPADTYPVIVTLFDSSGKVLHTNSQASIQVVSTLTGGNKGLTYSAPSQVTGFQGEAVSVKIKMEVNGLAEPLPVDIITAVDTGGTAVTEPLPNTWSEVDNSIVTPHTANFTWIIPKTLPAAEWTINVTIKRVFSNGSTTSRANLTSFSIILNVAPPLTPTPCVIKGKTVPCAGAPGAGAPGAGAKGVPPGAKAPGSGVCSPDAATMKKSGVPLCPPPNAFCPAGVGGAPAGAKKGGGKVVSIQSSNIAGVFTLILVPTPCPSPTLSPTPKPTEAPFSLPTPEPLPTAKAVNPGVPGAPGSPGAVPTVNPIHTKISLDLLLTGIGASGNSKPVAPQRPVKVEVFDKTSKKVVEKTGVVTFDPSSGSFVGIIDMGSLASGAFAIKVTTPRYLRKLIGGGIQVIQSAELNQLSQSSLVSGDINGDNVIDAKDYNIYVACFGAKADSPNCGANRVFADLNDDGKNDGPGNLADYKLLFAAFSNQGGN